MSAADTRVDSFAIILLIMDGLEAAGHRVEGVLVSEGDQLSTCIYADGALAHQQVFSASERAEVLARIGDPAEFAGGAA